MEPVISFENVSVKNQNIIALQNVNVNINQGEYIGIFGPNGSGKTTFLKTILGLIEPFTGTVTVLGSQNIKKVRSNVGYVPQNISVKKTFPATVLDVVEMGLFGKIGFMKPLKTKDKKQAEEALHTVHLEAYKNRPIGHLSGGELQKVMVARALASKPYILLLDEPTSALDFMMVKDLMTLLVELNNNLNITIIAINHHLDLLQPYCSRLLLMDGTIIYDGEPYNPEVEQIIKQIFSF
ncbi:MAG: ABC transporter ATP-binding protein [Candidatus Lokiarchaeota archaeon]|nr:ABC transporter ATP-binding protein [Candidatus Lokiarchaeota archaeon]